MTTNDAARVCPRIVLAGVPAAQTAAVEARFAARGYTVAVADIDDAPDIETALARVGAALAMLRALPGPAAPVAVAGYAAGGRYAFLAVTRLKADGAVAFWGSGIGAHLGEAPAARVPMSLHFADDDPHVQLAEVRAIKGALEGIGCIEIYRYPQFDDAAQGLAERRAFEVLDVLQAPFR
jgi:dienelactone hydrolase